MKKVRVKVPASTTNLGPGFDTLGIALNLYNTIELKVAGWIKKSCLKATKLTVEIVGEGKDTLPKDKRNFAYQSAQRVFNILNLVPSTLHLKLINQVPIAYGLGSSATARIGGLIATNKLCGNKLTTDQILNLAAELEGHSDNAAPALFGGLVVSCLTNQGVKYVKLDRLHNLSIVICLPDFQVSTKVARRVLPKQVLFSSAVFNTNRTALLLSALTKKRYDLLPWAMEDRLHQPFRKKLMPQMDDVIKAALKAGAYGSALSGAGPAIMALSIKHKMRLSKIARAMEKAFARNHTKSKTLILQIDKQGTVAKSY